MNLKKLNKQGFDSIRMPNISSGVEICLYEPYRIKIVGLVHWNNDSVSFKDLKDFTIEPKRFSFLTQNREIVFDKEIEEDHVGEYMGCDTLSELMINHPVKFSFYMDYVSHRSWFNI